VKLTAAVLNHSSVSSSSYYVRPTGEDEAEKVRARRVRERRGAARR
jgi:hypothetical protein